MHALAARRLMEPVDILGHHREQFALALPFGELQMRLVGLCGKAEHLVAVKAVELLGVSHEEGVAEYLLGRIIVLLVIQSVRGAKVGYAALGGYPRASEKHYPMRVFDDLPELFDVSHYRSLPMTRTF